MSQDEQAAVYEQVQTAYDAYNALTDEQKGQITGAEVFNELFAMFNGMIEPLAEGTYNLNSGSITITEDGTYTVTGSTTANTITASSGVTATMTLQNVTIDLSGVSSATAFTIQTGANVTLILDGSSTLTSGTDSFGSGSPGIYLPSGASLTIQGSGSLTVNGGDSTNSGGTGIGGNAGNLVSAAGACGTVTITSGTVNVNGGNGGNGGVAIGGGGSSDSTDPGSFGGAGIGGGSAILVASAGAGGTVVILTPVTVTGGSGGDYYHHGSAIGGGQGIQADGAPGQGIRPTGTSGTYEVYGDLELPDGVTFPDGITINIPDGASLTLPEGASWPDNVTITGSGTISPKLTATITITANLDKTHDGSAVSLDNSGYTYTGDTTTPTITITWHEDNSGTIGDALTSAPSAPGIYWVKVSAAETSRYAAAEATKKFTISQPLDAPTGLTWSTTTPGQATWNTVTNASGYDLQLYKDGSTQGSPVTTSGTSYDFANTITQAGRYTFTVTATGSGAYSDSSPSSQSAALYTVSFDTNGGTGTIPMQLVPNGGTATAPAEPTRTGHRFDGWYSDSTFAEGSEWDFDTDTVTAATTLYARWTANTYKVTLETNGGTVGSGNITSYTYGQGAILPTDVTREGYVFAGWYEDSGFSGSEVTVIGIDETGPRTYYARWISTNAGVSGASVDGTPGAVNGSEISVVLPYGTASLPTDGSAVSITPAAGATVSNPVLAESDGSKWTFTVTAEDGVTTADYTITVTIAPDPAVENEAAVAAARTAVENRTWTVPQATANTEERVRAWIEGQVADLAEIGQNGVNYTVTITDFTAADGGTAADRDGTDGSFSFAVRLSKGTATGDIATDTYAEATATVTAGTITAAAYTGEDGEDAGDGGDSTGSTGSGDEGGTTAAAYISRTLSGNGVTLSGSGIHRDARLTVTEGGLHEAGSCEGCDRIRAWQDEGRVIAVYDVSLSQGFQGSVTVTFPVAGSYNGRTLTVVHCLDNRLETYQAEVTNGTVRVTVDSLSPFAILDNEDSGTTGTGSGDGGTQQVTGPQTGDNSSIGLWFSLILLSLSGIVVLLMTRRVRRRMEDE